MDLLTSILKQTGLKSRLIAHRSFTKSSSIQFPCSKSIGFHVVTHGIAYIHSDPQKKPIELKKGDIALMARGFHHSVSTEEKTLAKSITLQDFDRLPSRSKDVKLTLVSGAYQLWNDPIHPFFTEMPDWYILRSEDIPSFDSLQTMINLLAEETATPDLGTERIVHGILDVMFSQIMRKIIERISSQTKTWSHALQDVEIKRALEIMHSNVSRSWGLDELAKKVGLSRAGFAMKFKRSMGDTPLHYLTILRIQMAIDLLTNTEKNIENIAFEVGYQDAFGFSKAFKKMTGLPPREFRLRNLNELKLGVKIV